LDRNTIGSGFTTQEATMPELINCLYAAVDIWLEITNFVKINFTMPEVIIKYESDKTLKMLKDLAKYFDFVLSVPKPMKKTDSSIHGVSFSPADAAIDISELSKIFTGKSIDAKTLRNKAWQRK
jgi:hypothetical protein